MYTFQNFAQAGYNESTIVKEYFPQQLSALSERINARGGPPPSQYFSYVDADLGGTGKKNYIVAVYSNGFSGAVRVLQKQGSTATLIASPSLPDMGGINPNVRLVDVDGDGRPEVVASFSTGNGATTADWVFKWDNEELHSISPGLNGVDFVDLTGDGKLNAVAADIDGPETDAGFPLDTAVYSLVNGKFVRTGTSYMFSYYRRSKGSPMSETQKFAVQNPGGQYELTVTNGGDTDKLVSSATIELNGATVASQKDFNQNTKVIKVPVTLKAANTITVTLNGAPGSLIAISVGTKISR